MIGHFSIKTNENMYFLPKFANHANQGDNVYKVFLILIVKTLNIFNITPQSIGE